MSRNKKWLAALLTLFLLPLYAGAESLSPSLISDEVIAAASVNYDTVTVELGELGHEVSLAGSEYYPHTYQLRLEGGNAKFHSYQVKRGSEVKKGDVLATFTVEEDPVAMASRKQALRQLQDAFEKGKESRLDEIRSLQEKMTLTGDRMQKRALSLKLQYEQTALEKYIYQQENAILDAEKAIRELEEKWAQTQLIAPEDGVITSIVHLREGDFVSSGQVLIEMYRTDDMLILVRNDNGYLRYGMDVTVSIGRNQKKAVLQGKVVGADTLLPKAAQRNIAFVKLEPHNREELLFTNISVKVKVSHLPGVIVVPRSLPTLESGKYFVTKLEDGVAKKRFVECFFSGKSPLQAWIVQGIEVGDVLIED